MSDLRQVQMEQSNVGPHEVDSILLTDEFGNRRKYLTNKVTAYESMIKSIQLEFPYQHPLSFHGSSPTLST